MRRIQESWKESPIKAGRRRGVRSPKAVKSPNGTRLCLKGQSQQPLSQAADSADSHGLSVGAKAPRFTLKDKDGKDHTPAELRKKAKFVALVFYRSADW